MVNEVFSGDDIYKLCCTGDAVTGDEVRFSQAMFSGSFRKPKFAGYRLITGVIVNDSYGQDKQQHTFTLKLEDGSSLKIKGRNLYRNGTWRKPWPNESDRENALAEKHAMGNTARAERERRLNEDRGIYTEVN